MRRKFDIRDRVIWNWNVLWRKFGKAICLVLFVILIAYGLYQLFIRVFTIRFIEVVGDPINIAVDQSRFTKNILLFPQKKIEDQILLENPHLASISITKIYPQTLRIQVTLRKAVANLQTSQHIYLLDSYGMVLTEGITDKKNIPNILFDIKEPLVSGKKVVHPSVAKSLEFISLFGNTASITAITVESSGTVRAEINQSVVVFDQYTNISQMSHTLQTLLNRFRMKGTQPATVDLRFEKPVVGFE